ncbi:hypothetical protein ABIB94_009066 [Bradyrhizobium sp. JR7.2]|uniref:DUF4189 domain-containing protein n=1 Tax=unclassified Bradyrhizobium TaxID=2631580 RepID=UPI003393C0A3
MRKLIIGVLALFIPNATAFAGCGAIAYSKPDDVVGFSCGSRSQWDARWLALLDCHRKGGSDCKIEAYGNYACNGLGLR